MANATTAPTVCNERCPSPDASRLESGVKPTCLLMSGRVVAFAATFFVPVVLARILTVAEFGTYKQLFLLYATLYYIAQFGIAESLFYFLPTASHRAGRYVANAMLCLTATGLACWMLLGAASPTLASWLNNPELMPYLTWIGAFLLLMLVSSVLEIAMVARGRYVLASATYGISDVLRAVFFVLPALAFRHIDVLLIGAVSFAVLRLAATLAYVVRMFGTDMRPRAAALTQQLRYTLPFGVATVMEICQANLHLYAVSYYVDAATFAIYAVGCLQIPVVDLVATSAGNVMMVRMGQNLRDRRDANNLAIWRETTRHLALVLVPLVGILLVSAHTLIVMLFTEQYAAAAPIFMIWSLAILPAIFMTDAALRVYAQTRFLLYLNAIRLGLIVLVIRWAIGTFHLTGVVMLTVVATLLSKTLGALRVARVMKVAPADLVPWDSVSRIVLAAAVAAVVARMTLTALTWPALPSLVVVGSLYAAVYAALIWRLEVLTPPERLAAIERLQRWTGQTYVWDCRHRQRQ
jgi:O-antigen/teichoic acid export membrane protein